LINRIPFVEASRLLVVAPSGAFYFCTDFQKPNALLRHYEQDAPKMKAVRDQGKAASFGEGSPKYMWAQLW